MSSRRNFIKLATSVLAAGVIGPRVTDVQAKPTANSLAKEYQGTDLDGWEVIVSDGGYAAIGEAPVDINDIETLDYGTHSELRANIQERRISAHNMTFKKITDDSATDCIHICEYDFKIPSTSQFNGQTIEGGFNVWDGMITRSNYTVLFQWILNYLWEEKFEDMHNWVPKDSKTGMWQTVGAMTLDEEWHRLRIVMDFKRRTTSMTIDGKPYPSCLVITSGPDDWGTEIAAWIATEIISIDPDEGPGKLHKAHIKDWYWAWEPSNTCKVFLPSVSK